MKDNRKHERRKVNFKSEVHSEEGLTFSNTVDISPEGIFISTPEPLSIGTLINLALQIPGGDPVEIKGYVKWVRNTDNEVERAGMGIAFADVSEKETKKLLKVLQ